jgi:hypothetical protein
MKATKLLHNLGQSLWLDKFTRDLLDSGTLKRWLPGFRMKERSCSRNPGMS